MLLEYFLLTLTFVVGHGRIVNFEEEGGLPDEMSDDTAWKNGNLMNVTLNSLLPGLYIINGRHTVLETPC